jgi:Fe-S oxidoreductase/nitrate reductase gamma subunit
MEATREIYWNVGHGVLWPMYLLTFAALGVCLVWFRRRLPVYRQGRPLLRTDRPGERIVNALRGVLLQGKVLRQKGAGTAHSLFFWGFVLLLIGTLLIFVQADISDPLFGVHFLRGTFYRYFSLVLDLAGVAALLMLGGLFVRRYLVRPAGLESGRDDLLMHGLLFAILVSGFVVEGLRMAVTELVANPELARWSPVGLVLAQGFSGTSEATLRTLHQGLWWGHFALALAFIVVLPVTRLRHIVTTSLNYFFADLGPKGNVVTLDLEDEGNETFGAAKVSDLTWKDLFDADACTLCKRCQDRCPAHATDKPLSPMQLVSQIGEAAFTAPEEPLLATVERDAIWSCTTCRACQEICPAGIEHLPKILEIRRNLVLMEGEFPGDEVVAAVDNTEVNGNPLGMAFAVRGDWTEGLGIKALEEDLEVDILYFVGCYASFDKRNIKIARSFLRLCQAAGIKVGILGREEKCCGDPVRKLGNEYLYQNLAADNIERIKGYGVRQIVTTCPHCFNALGKDYRDLGLDVAVEHYTVYLHRLLEEGRLRVKAEPFSCTYHDSCYLGRYNEILAEPRALIRAAGGELREMDRHGLESFCCGAGGGRILVEEKLGSRISETRAKMAATTGADVLVSNCPFCLSMFEDGIKGAELQGDLVPRDIAEILAERIDKRTL